MLIQETCGLRLQALRMAPGKGFGQKRAVEEKETIKTTRATMHKKVLGQYAKMLARESNRFDAIKGAQGSIVDIYARLEGSQDCWFIGKIAHEGVEMDEVARGHQDILCEYAKSLRPKELAGPEASTRALQLWWTEGDNEIAVAQNKLPLLPMLLRPRGETGTETGADSDADAETDAETETGTGTETGAGTGRGVAFQAEVYNGEEEGFRCTRDAAGKQLEEAFDVNFEAPDSANFK